MEKDKEIKQETKNVSYDEKILELKKIIELQKLTNEINENALKAQINQIKINNDLKAEPITKKILTEEEEVKETLKEWLIEDENKTPSVNKDVLGEK